MKNMNQSVCYLKIRGVPLNAMLTDIKYTESDITAEIRLDILNYYSCIQYSCNAIDQKQKTT